MPELPFGRTSEDNYAWKNWAGNLEVVARTYFEPSSVAELQDVVRRAKAEGRKVRVAGSSLSWSGLVPTDDFIVCLDRIDEIGPFDTANLRVTVQTGANIGEVTKAITRHGLALRSPTVITYPSVGGMIGTAVHGSSLAGSTFSDYVRAFHFVDADGELRTIDASTPTEHAAMMCAMGSLGIVYAVELECEPAFRVVQINERMEIRTAIASIPDMLERYEFVDLFWFPYTNDAWWKLSNRTTLPARIHPVDYVKTALSDLLLEKIVAPPALKFVANYVPKQTPFFMQTFAALSPQTHTLRVEDASTAFHYERYYPYCYDIEYSVPTADSQDAWKLFVDQVMATQALGVFPVNMVVHSRWIRGSKALIAPANDRDSCHIEALSVKPTPGYETFYRDLEDAILTRFPDARPHWGKLYYQPTLLKSRYPRMNEFLAVRQTLDPEQRFLNPFLRDQVFQIPPI